MEPDEADDEGELADGVPIGMPECMPDGALPALGPELLSSWAQPTRAARLISAAVAAAVRNVVFA